MLIRMYEPRENAYVWVDNRGFQPDSIWFERDTDQVVGVIQLQDGEKVALRCKITDEITEARARARLTHAFEVTWASRNPRPTRQEVDAHLASFGKKAG